MKLWILTPMLGSLLLGGNWASAQPQGATLDISPAVGGVAQSATGSVSGGGTIVVQGGDVAVPVPLPGITVTTGNGVVQGVIPVPRPGMQPGQPGPMITVRRGPDGQPLLNAPQPIAAQVQVVNGGGPVWFASGTATLAGKTEKTSFLGVTTTRVTGTLRSQLKLSAGLVVETIEPKSPAETAGLQVHDILEKFDDQWLINPAQFIGLIRMYKPGDTVTLTVLRQGERKKITAKLEERMSYVVADDDGDFFYAQQGMFDPNAPRGPVSLTASPVAGFAGPVQQVTSGVLGAAPLVPGFVATFGDDKQELLISIHDGHQILTAKDSSGKQIFKGPIDTPEQRKELPQDVRKKLEEMERIKIRVRTQSFGGEQDGSP